MKPRQIKAMATKRRIFETALHLFQLRGYSNVSVDEIVQESGTSKGAFYTHFKSKHEIFLEQFKKIDAFYLEFQTHIPETENVVQTLSSLVVAQMGFLRSQLGLDLVRTIYITELNPETDHFLIRYDRPLYVVVRNVVERGQKSGELRTDMTSDEMTKLITRCMRGTLYDWCILGDDMDLVHQGEKLIMTLLRGLCSSKDI